VLEVAESRTRCKGGIFQKKWGGQISARGGGERHSGGGTLRNREIPGAEGDWVLGKRNT